MSRTAPSCEKLRFVSDLTGKPAIPFRLRGIDGRVHTLEEYRGGWLLMVFHRHFG